MYQYNQPRVLIVYQYIATYRFPVFVELARSSEIRFEFMAGTTGRGETPRFGTASELAAAEFDWIPAHNYWLPGGMLWQSNVIRASLGSKYDAIIYLGDMHYISTWIGLIARHIMGKTSFLWTIGMHRPERGCKLAIRNRFHGLAQHIFVYGEYARNLMQEAGVPGCKMTTIGNSLDYERQKFLIGNLEIEPTNLGSENFSIISIGRLTARRRLNRLLEAVAKLSSEGVSVHATLIGDGSERGCLEALTQELGIEDLVTFKGAVYDEEMIARYAYNADICVVPGVIGLGAIHAHSYGLPVITCGDMSIQAPEAEVIEPGLTGSFCEWDDAESVAHELRKWIEAKRDRDAVRQACLAAIERKWTPQRQRELIERVVLRTIRSERGHAAPQIAAE